MSLLGWPLLALAVLLAAGLPAFALWAWNRVPGPVGTRVAAHLTMIFACQLAAVLLIGVAVNDRFQFFTSWTDLFGTTPSNRDLRPATVGAAPTRRPPVPFRRDAATDAYVATFTGSRSRVRAQVWVWLPRQYHDPRFANARFPVIELFPGYPGSPPTWLHAMRAGERLDRLVAARRSHPFVLVAATITVWPGHDTECSDLPAGPRVATWLTHDVREVVDEGFRVTRDPRGWGLMGYSTGGFCAVKLAVQYPSMFGAAVSLAGYSSPTSPLLTALPALRAPNDPLWLLRHGPHPRVPLLLAGSRQDPGTVTSIRQLSEVARPPTRVYSLIVDSGGHNVGVWSAMLPAAYQWLSRELPPVTG